MDFYIASATDAGVKRTENQDSLFVRRFDSAQGPVAFAVLCDGMGGLKYGKTASASLADAFSVWACKVLPGIQGGFLEDYVIRGQWTELIQSQNAVIRAFGQSRGCLAGSTVTALLATASRYYILNIGDTRAYEIGGGVRQLTWDHTVIADEIRLGNIAPERAKDAPVGHVLTRCVGAAERVHPDLFFGETRGDSVYMLCSDGFWHHIMEDELLQLVPREGARAAEQMQRMTEKMIDWNKQRGETDNISVIAVYAKS